MAEREKTVRALRNRVTCTLCGARAEGSISEIIEWDKNHVCPVPEEEPDRG